MENNNRDNNTPITFGEIALALAADYESIYVIDADDDSYVEYMTQGADNELIKRSAGENFYKDTIKNCRELVYKDDQDYFLESFKKENVTEILTSGKSFSLDYRLLVDGEPLFYYLKTIRGFGNKVIIGVRNVDEQKRKEMDSNIRLELYSQIAGALASRYEVIYHINVKNNNYTQYSSSDDYARLGLTMYGDDFFVDAANDIRKYVFSEDMDRILSIMQKDKLLKNLEETGSQTIHYRQFLGDDIKYVSMIVVRPKNDEDHIVIGVLDVDAQVKREQLIMRESEIFDEIALALATRYEVIYHVDIITNEYSEYSASEKYSKIEVGMNGRDFFYDTHNNMKIDIYPDDYPMMEKAMDKKNLLKSLAESGKIFLNYRLMLEGRPQYMTLFAVHPKEDSDHIIIAIANVDAAKRKEEEFEAAIDSAMDMANRDALTGVKNLHAYTTFIKLMDDSIEDEHRDEGPFSIVVFDINGLKEVNDTFGHSAGDDFIKNACALICEIYKHSPVFRIGGDEFVVILKGSDFRKRDELFLEFKNKQKENRRKGLVTLAGGMADFISEKDTCVQDAFKRADSLMYEYKRRFKELKGDDEDENYYPESRRYKLDKLFEAFSIVADGTYVYLCDMVYDISRWSKNAVNTFGLPDEYMFNAGGIWEKRIHPDDIDVYHSQIDSIFQGKAAGHDMQYRAKKLDGEYIICTCRGTVLFDENGVPEYFAGSIRNNSVRENVDSLTGLSNQYGFLETLKENMFREKEMEITLLGIGKFAEFNEVYGYDFGNKILQKFSRHLYEFVGNTGNVFRMDGTKFAIISNTFEPDEIRKRYEILRKYCRTDFVVDGRSLILDLNAGLLSVKSFDADSQAVYACLSYAYSESKLHKQGDLVKFSNDPNTENAERIERLHYIRGSIMKNYDGFYLLYQPVVDSKTEKLIGAEALIRWKSERYGIVPPDQFIPLLEKDPLFPELGEWILERALIDAKRIMNKVPDFVVNVNLSYTQLEKGGFVDMVLRKLKEQNYPPDHLCLEITERCRLLDMKILKNVIDILRSYGVKIALDDFGTGFSSIGLVKSLPFDTIKIDRSFVTRIEEDEKEKALVENFVNVASTFGAKVCIEGIETAGMKEILQKYRVQSFQGYYYGKPLSIAELETQFEK